MRTDEDQSNFWNCSYFPSNTGFHDTKTGSWVSRKKIGQTCKIRVTCHVRCCQSAGLLWNYRKSRPWLPPVQNSLQFRYICSNLFLENPTVMPRFGTIYQTTDKVGGIWVEHFKKLAPMMPAIAVDCECCFMGPMLLRPWTCPSVCRSDGENGTLKNSKLSILWQP